MFVDNDANVALLAEHRAGAAAGARNALMLTLGTGIGGGLVLDGELYRGRRGTGGELGHVVVDLDGPPCQGKCPNRGCLETLASGTALEREALLGDGAAADRAGGRARWRTDGDATARRAARADRPPARGRGLAAWSTCSIPTSWSSAAASSPRATCCSSRRARSSPRGRCRTVREVRIVPARFGEESGMLGAALLAREGAAARASV